VGLSDRDQPGLLLEVVLTDACGFIPANAGLFELR